ncbi:chromosome-associated kinesin KIF4-like isoform X2 [Penaeus japonicus]|uniref:chromosome-associated kinesin KIF4-like isoform X2 n=1 Tax=Penaeus japonicus TaxID=27405 RepID=UPI001C714AFA|nr:chromosome-associated kinesin KIF4-like isoform X2 [Penaeus japonicus]
MRGRSQSRAALLARPPSFKLQNKPLPGKSNKCPVFGDFFGIIRERLIRMVSEDSSGSKVIPVRVAVRVRPLLPKELREGCQECIDLTPGESQVVIRGTEKAFTYDFAFASETSQGYVYESAVKKVVQNLFKGYNVTVLAYGQTGSGKTHSMGTAYTKGVETDDEAGIIPRAVRDIFEGVSEKKNADFLVKVSFIELYKESLFDLLTNKSRDECAVDIREDPRGGIKIVGLTEIPVTTLEETMRCLERGAQNRATGATAMNARSSRSHAIFSLHIEQKNKNESESIMCAKFHLVDLAGSERAKKTGATGERFKEGVNINKGLLALGNVISALCEEGNRGHVPYRDSKLTRLLQDSLGGNSHTVMLACVSPADSNMEETLSTLRYADRARKIKNKPVINRDPQAAEIAKLRQQVQQLQVQLLASSSSGGGVAITSSDELNALLSQNRLLQEENEKLSRALHSAIDENTNMAEKALLAEMARDRLKTKLEELRAQTGNTVEVLNKTLDVTLNPQYEDQLNLVKDLQKKVVELQSEQKKGEKVMMEHELSRHNISTNTSVVNSDDTTTTEAGVTQDTVTDNSPSKHFGTEYTLRQAKLNEELQDLNRALAMKEELMSKMTTNDAQMVAMRSVHDKEKKDLESHIEILSKEKDELMQQLRAASHNQASGKIAEQRRKRVQELEGQLSALKKKQLELMKMIRLKEQSEQKVSKLNTEIQAMKATRVKLIRQMKEDSEKFRVWKAQKDKEVAKLKEADRRKQYQIVKMERLHSKQQNVLRRKMEEAIAINKRLKDAMALQKAGAEKRAASRETAGIGNRVKNWLEGELEVVTVKKQAKQSLENLMDDRKTISDQINKAKRQLRNGQLTKDLTADLETKVKSLENDLQLRTAQINDLQSKIMDGDEDAASRKRFDSMQSMVEAKCALNYLFEVAATGQVNTAAREADLKDLQSQYEEVAQSLEDMEAELKTLKECHQAELTRISREHEDKVLFLLRQMPKAEDEGETASDENNEQSKDGILMERLKFQEAEIARLSELYEELQAKRQECEELKKQLTVSAVTQGNRVSLMPNISLGDRRRTFVKPGPTKKPSPTEVLSESDEESDEEEEEETKRKDPDWRKTPLYKRIRQITGNKTSFDEEEEDQENEDGKKRKSGSKRDSSGDIRCGCKGDCSKKLCACRKGSNSCNLKCKCNILKCKNRSTPDTSLSETSKNDTLLNSTFEVGSVPLSENSSNKRPRLLGMSSSYNDSSSQSDDDAPTGLMRIKTKMDFLNSPSLF